MKLSIVIVNYNVKYYLDQCLRSVLAALSVLNDSTEVIVVDNHSVDGSVEYLEHRYPKSTYPMIRFVSCMHNLGFARANNIAIRQSQGEYVLLLNPDTFVGEQVIGRCVAFMDAHDDAGALGVRMLGANGQPAMESRRGLPTPVVSFYKMLGLCNRWPTHRIFGRYYMGYLPWDKPAQIEVVSGAFCMLRRKAIDRVGLLDETFFMYGEDIDLSYRVLKSGFHNYYLPVDILHYKGESTQKSSFRYVHVFYEAMLIFFRKHYAGMSWLFSLPVKTAIYGKAFVALVGMMGQRMRKSLGFFSPHDRSDAHYVMVGGKAMLDACRDLAMRLGLDAEFHQEVEPSQWRLGKVNYLVLDAEEMRYEEMLEVIRRLSQQGDCLMLGTYHQEIGKIITGEEVL